MKSFTKITRYSVLILILGILSFTVRVDAMRPVDQELQDLRAHTKTLADEISTHYTAYANQQISADPQASLENIEKIQQDAQTALVRVKEITAQLSPEDQPVANNLEKWLEEINRDADRLITSLESDAKMAARYAADFKQDLTQYSRYADDLQKDINTLEQDPQSSLRDITTVKQSAKHVATEIDRLVQQLQKDSPATLLSNPQAQLMEQLGLISDKADQIIEDRTERTISSEEHRLNLQRRQPLPLEKIEDKTGALKTQEQLDLETQQLLQQIEEKYK